MRKRRKENDDTSNQITKEDLPPRRLRTAGEMVPLNLGGLNAILLMECVNQSMRDAMAMGAFPGFMMPLSVQKVFKQAIIDGIATGLYAMYTQGVSPTSAIHMEHIQQLAAARGNDAPCFYVDMMTYDPTLSDSDEDVREIIREAQEKANLYDTPFQYGFDSQAGGYIVFSPAMQEIVKQCKAPVHIRIIGGVIPERTRHKIEFSCQQTADKFDIAVTIIEEELTGNLTQISALQAVKYAQEGYPKGWKFWKHLESSQEIERRKTASAANPEARIYTRTGAARFPESIGIKSVSIVVGDEEIAKITREYLSGQITLAAYKSLLSGHTDAVISMPVELRPTRQYPTESLQGAAGDKYKRTAQDIEIMKEALYNSFDRHDQQSMGIFDGLCKRYEQELGAEDWKTISEYVEFLRSR